MPKISVIIPVYNTEKYLQKCLDSVLSQTLQDFEIIIVNDGSPDNSKAIIDDYVSRYSDKITALYQENAGQASARNNGLSVAKGEYISFLDSDDYLAENAFEKTYTYAIKNELDIVCFNFYTEADGNAIQEEYRLCHSNDAAKRYIITESSPCNKLISNKIITDNNVRFTENMIYEDLDLIPRLALYTDKIGFMDDRLYHYVIHDNSTMHQKKYNPKLASIYKAMETLKTAFLNTKFTDELEYLYIEHLLHGSVLRYLRYKEGANDIIKISNIVKANFPHWRKNKYYKTMNWKYKTVCNLAYLKQVSLLRYLLKINVENA